MRLAAGAQLDEQRAHTQTYTERHIYVTVERPEPQQSQETVESAPCPRHKQQLLTSPKINRARAWESWPANLYNYTERGKKKKKSERESLGKVRQLCLIKATKPRKMWRDTERLGEGEESWIDEEGARGKREEDRGEESLNYELISQNTGSPKEGWRI